MRRLRPPWLLTVLSLLAAVLTGCSHGHRTPPEQLAAQAYLTALGGADATAAAQSTTDASAAQKAIAASLAGLGAGAKGTLTVTGLVDRTPTSATANYDARWTLPGSSTPWTYSGTLPVLKSDKVWLVSWKIGDVQPELSSGHHLQLKRTQPTRAALTDDKGAPLFRPTPVVTVGIDPAKVTDLGALAAALAAVPQLQSSAHDIVSAVQAAAKDQFVPVITLRRPVYEAIKPRIYNLPGTEFQEGTQLLPPVSGFARQFLGTVGEATKQLIDGSGGAIAAGDEVGTSGLQLALDAQLRGQPGLAVYLADDASGALGSKLATITAPAPGKPVQLTLDTAAQEAADQVLSAEPLPAAIVVSQPSTGRVLAVANSESAPGDIALTGQYPAGSTFKIVTYAADLTANPGHSQDTQAPCPPTVTVDGRQFENENKFSHGTISYAAAFGYSCNTTAISVADALPDGTMARTAAALGLGAGWKLPVDAFSGSMPATATGTEKAAEAIGQGKVLVSPLAMAGIVSAAATGKPVTPSILQSEPGTPGTPLDASVVAKLNALLHATVDLPGATAYTALNGLPGDIRGKTGTAEFGTDVPPKSHSWFVGVRGDLAISVFIYGGEQSSTGAVVLARDFFTALPPG
ncbi:MAG TPA: penicillin-binding transpeptidase domain-containing protein [Jatrophihabitans sp.]|nr:penicillin-binding transpeptidase domain-containing protein [Jatrophihabitans sp.]